MTTQSSQQRTDAPRRRTLPTIWNELYHCPDASTVLSTRKHKMLVEDAQAAGLLDLRSDDAFDEEHVWAEISLIHSPQYVNAVRTGVPRTLAESQGFTWCQALVAAVSRGWSGTHAAVRVAMQEGMAFHAASGAHHAERDHGAGFCTFNDVAGVGRLLLDQGKLERVAVIDLDTHQGNGTWSLAGSDERFGFFDVAHASWSVPEIETARAVFRIVRGDAEYFDVLKGLPAFLRTFQPSLVFYLAGMDCHESDDMGGVPGMDWARLAERDRFVFEQIEALGVPLIFSPAGGYQADGTTIALHLNTIRAALRLPAIPVVAPARDQRTYRCVLRDRNDVPLRTIEWIGVPPETILVAGPLAQGAPVAAPADARPRTNEVAFRRMLYRPRVLVTYYTCD